MPESQTLWYYQATHCSASTKQTDATIENAWQTLLKVLCTHPCAALKRTLLIYVYSFSLIYFRIKVENRSLMILKTLQNHVMFILVALKWHFIHLCLFNILHNICTWRLLSHKPLVQNLWRLTFDSTGMPITFHWMRVYASVDMTRNDWHFKSLQVNVKKKSLVCWLIWIVGQFVKEQNVIIFAYVYGYNRTSKPCVSRRILVEAVLCTFYLNCSLPSYNIQVVLVVAFSSKQALLCLTLQRQAVELLVVRGLVWMR